ncbi:MAG TPA: hypothetical protein DDX19_00185 [Rhodopirellula baltica]|nr:hypothetical protein [Rhodopirellula baltica]
MLHRVGGARMRATTSDIFRRMRMRAIVVNASMGMGGIARRHMMVSSRQKPATDHVCDQSDSTDPEFHAVPNG